MLLKHPQSNGQTELAKKVKLEGLKTWLNEAKGQWVDKLPSILWSYHMSPQITTQETSFKLTYECEAMIPVKVR